MADSFIIEGDFSQGWAQRANASFPESVYETKLVSFEKSVNDKSGKESVKCGFEIQGGDYSGAKINKSLGLDLSKSGNQAQWVSLLVATGVDEKKAKATKKFDLAKLAGKTFYIYVRPPAEGEQYGDRNIVHPDDVEDMIKSFGKNGATINGDDAGESAAPKAKANGSTKAATPQPAADEGELDLG